jgi:hypothetical protein
MKKYTIISLSSLLLIIMAAFSCSKSLDNSEEALPQKKVNANIPANFASSKVVADGGTATFSTAEKVYVYNNTTSTLDTDYLSPDADGTTANLKGSLSGTYSVGDNLKLLYNTTSEGVADYTNQDGTLENVVDAATATVKVQTADAESFTTRTAYFENLQSIFKFTFKDEDNNIINVKSLTILSENNKLQSSFNLVEEAVTYGGINVTCNTAQSTVYVALRFTSNPSEMILFSVMDENGKVYTGSKTSPTSGFKIGRFYTSTVSVKAHTFTIAKDKKVYFALSNLYDDGGIYKFQSCPWTVSDGGSNDFFELSVIRNTMASSENSITVSGIEGWYAPSDKEWEGLNEGHYGGSASQTYTRHYIDNSNYTIRPYKIVTDEKTNNIFGLMYLPDDFTYNEDRAELELEENYNSSTSRYKKNVNLFKYLAKGCVFFPEYTHSSGFSPQYGGSFSNLVFSSATNGTPRPNSSNSGGTLTPVPVRLIHE